MKQVVVLSGKGGTGKTCVTASFAHLAHAGLQRISAVLADADVDASNLELVLQPEVREEHVFEGGAVAVIDHELCEGCGTCLSVCRFEAILEPGADGRTQYEVDPIACDGCAACVYTCPTSAVRMQPQIAGAWFDSSSRFGPLYHAALKPAQENSGKLVTLVKQQARLRALDQNIGLALVDGPPGIGCPVISAASGASLALIVAEPSAAGIHDLERVLDLTAHFELPTLVCINKADIYPEGSAQIEAACQERGVEVIGRIPFDASVTEAMVQGEPVTAFRPDAPASLALREIWARLSERINDESN